MGCRIMGDDMACFYCSVTDIAFGPVATRDELERFRSWMGQDPRSELNIMQAWGRFVKYEETDDKQR